MNGYRTRLAHGLENNPDAKTVRRMVFVEEQGFTDEFDETDRVAYHVVVYDGEIPAATGRLFEKGNGCWGVGRVAVQRAYRGKKLGRLVMDGLEEQARALGAERISLSSQLHARGFYETLGYRAHGEIYYEQHCPHIAMEKRLL